MICFFSQTQEDQNRPEYFDIQFSIEDPAKLHLLTIQNQLEDINPASSLHQSATNKPVNPTKEILAIDEQVQPHPFFIFFSFLIFFNQA
jgi:hypothetical protein